LNNFNTEERLYNLSVKFSKELHPVTYKQLDYLTRCKIYGLWRAGHNQTQIAKEIGVHKSTIKKGSDFSAIGDDELPFIMDRLNNRPRKSLGYATPNEVFLSG
jgi:IS30 family transposase